MNLSRRIILFFLIVLPVLLVVGYSYIHIKQYTIERLYEERRSIATLSEHVLKEKLDRITDLGLSFSTRPVVCQNVGEHKWEDAISLMKKVPTDFPYIDRVLITDTSGTLMADVPRIQDENGNNLSQSNWYRGYSKNHQPYLSEVYMGADSNLEVLSAYAVPIKNAKGQVSGILILQIKITKLLEWTKQIGAGSRGFVYVVDQKGGLAIDPQYPNADSIIDYSSVPVVQKALKGGEKAEILYNPIEKEDRLEAYQSVPGYGWAVFVAEEADAALAANSNMRFITIFYSIIILLTFCFAYFITYEINWRRKAEVALKNSLKEVSDFKMLFESAPGLYLILTPDLKIKGASEEFLNTTLLKREKIIGSNVFDSIVDLPGKNIDYITTLRASFDKVLNTGKADAMPILKFDSLIQGAINKEGYWAILNKPVLNDKGNVVYIIHSIEDHTQRIKHEQDILRATEEIRELYDKAPCGYLSVDSDIFLCDINQTLLQWLGYSADEVIGKMKYEELLSPASRAAHLNTFEVVFAEYIKNGYVNDLEYEFQRKDGSIFPALVNSFAVLDETGNFSKSRSTVFDNTERKKSEERQKEVNRELEAFSYSVSHDLRAPLRGINGFARILMEDYGSQLDEEANRLMNIIILNANKMAQLIDDLLAFSRLGRKEILKADVSMMDMVVPICDEFKKEQSTRIVEFSIKELPSIYADNAAIKQVWINLISNAVKYSKLKEVATIEVGFEEKESEIIYYVKDNGAGFDMRYADKLFGVFQRLHSSEEFDGTGVGLAIVYKIITKHDGRVWAEGKKDEGATFYFSLPL